MQTNLIKNVEKIFNELYKLSKRSKMIVKYGIIAFFALFAVGTLLVVINHFQGYDSYMDLIATTIVKSSFTILAEVVIGVLLMEYFFNKQQ